MNDELVLTEEQVSNYWELAHKLEHHIKGVNLADYIPEEELVKLIINGYTDEDFNKLVDEWYYYLDDLPRLIMSFLASLEDK